MMYVALVRRLPCGLNISCTSTTAESRAKIWYKLNAFKRPDGLGCCPFQGGGSVVVDFFVYCNFHCGSL